MRFDEKKKIITLSKPELNIATLSLVELGGPFHSQFADHMNKFHVGQYKRILDDLYKTCSLSLDDASLLVDVVFLLLKETPGEDFGTYYDDVKEDNVKKLCEDLKKVTMVKSI